MRCFSTRSTSAVLKLTDCYDIECKLHNYTSVMLSSDNYKKRLLLGAVDKVHCFLIGKITILYYVSVENVTKSTNDAICFGGH